MKLSHKIIDYIIIVLAVFAAGSLLMIFSDASPAAGWSNFFTGIFGSQNGIADIFVKATPLILTGLGCAVAFKTGFFNIGAEGQFYMGALAASAVALNTESLPGFLRILLSMLAGFFCGGLWAFTAAVLKAKFGISEIIVTIMLNYIAIDFVGVAVRTFLMDPEGNVPQSAKITDSGLLYRMMPPTQLHAGIFIAVLAAAVVWFLFAKTTFGYEMKVVGFNKRAAQCNGISVMKNMILSAFISGGLAGLAGVTEVIGIQRKLLEGISSDCGYTAILVALLASNHPVGVVGCAILFAGMQVGANTMQRQLGVPSAIVNILMGLIVLLVLTKGMFRRKEAKHAE